MVADFDKVGTRGRHVEPYRALVVPLHGQHASVHVVKRHLAIEITLHHYLPVALIYHDIHRIYVANTLLGDIDGVVDDDSVVHPDGIILCQPQGVCHRQRVSVALTVKSNRLIIILQ